MNTITYKIINILLTLSALISGCAKSESTTGVTGASLIVFGDSISYGVYVQNSYTKQLAEYLSVPLQNYSAPATTLDSDDQIGRIRVKPIVKADIVLLTPGINDAAIHGQDPVYLNTYRSLLREALSIMTNQSSHVYLGTTLLTADGDPLNSDAEAYAQIARDLAAEFAQSGVHLIESRKAFVPDNTNMVDGVHPNELGHLQLFNIYKGYFN